LLVKGRVPKLIESTEQEELLLLLSTVGEEPRQELLFEAIQAIRSEYLLINSEEKIPLQWRKRTDFVFANEMTDLTARVGEKY
jgi:hypothetical protein